MFGFCFWNEKLWSFVFKEKGKSASIKHKCTTKKNIFVNTDYLEDWHADKDEITIIQNN